MNSKFAELKPNIIKKPYDEFKRFISQNRQQLTPTDQEWLAAWEIWDLANSPMADEDRCLLRYGHWLGWFHKVRFVVHSDRPYLVDGE